MGSFTDQHIFLVSAKKCCENAGRLWSDARMLECEPQKATLYFLSVIAQEESAKAFLLYLVSIQAIPWTPFILRATRDHKCKQLVGIILEYLAPDFDKWLRQMDDLKAQNKFLTFPKAVADALNILYHEKIRRWENDNWFWAEDPEYEKSTQQVADGLRDKEKQRGLYVDLGKNGQIASLPSVITNEQADEEFERADRYKRCVQGLLDGSRKPYDFEQIAEYFKGMFSQNMFIEAE